MRRKDRRGPGIVNTDDAEGVPGFAEGTAAASDCAGTASAWSSRAPAEPQQPNRNNTTTRGKQRGDFTAVSSRNPAARQTLQGEGGFQRRVRSVSEVRHPQLAPPHCPTFLCRQARNFQILMSAKILHPSRLAKHYFYFVWRLKNFVSILAKSGPVDSGGGGEAFLCGNLLHRLKAGAASLCART